MTWFDKHKRSRHTDDQERKALAESVEQLTIREKLNDNEWSEEEEEEEDVAAMGGIALIPPRLRLQSRPMPIVRIDAMKQELAGEDQGSDLVQMLTEPSKRLGRSTKVRLQAIRPGQDPVTERVPTLDTSEQREPARDGASARNRQVIVRRFEPPVAIVPTAPPSSLLCGSGMIEIGREDATVHNPRISAQSVVTVMLAGNPGPMVVHYISLQPRAGFTLHMSAPVTATTLFNYAIWLV